MDSKNNNTLYTIVHYWRYFIAKKTHVHKFNVIEVLYLTVIYHIKNRSID